MARSEGSARPGDETGQTSRTLQGHIHADADGAVILPDTAFATARFRRQGDDLILDAADGTAVTIAGYFRAAPPPDILTPEGTRLAPSLIEAFLPPEAPGQYAQAGAPAEPVPVGQVRDLDGDATVIRADGTRAPLAVGDALFLGDVVETGDDGSLDLQFADGAALSLEGDGRLALGGTDAGASRFALLQGLFVYTGGGRPAAIETPGGTVTLDGGTLAGEVTQAESRFTALDGAATVATPDGTVTLDRPNATTTLAAGQAPAAPFTLSGEEVAALYGGAAAGGIAETDTAAGGENEGVESTGGGAPPPGTDSPLRLDLEALFEAGPGAPAMPVAPPVLPADTATADGGGTHPDDDDDDEVIGTIEGDDAPPDFTPVIAIAPKSVDELDGVNGFAIFGEANGDVAGVSVASAGDFDGDGFDDIVLGANFNDPGGINAAGAAYLVFGGASFDTVDLSVIAAGVGGFKISGENVGDFAGKAVSSAGDLNGDGFDDLIIGATGNDSSGSDAGSSYVLLGRETRPDSVDLADISAGTGGFRIIGEGVDDESGGAVATAGDVNGDGYDDLIVGATGVEVGGSNTGAAYVIFGGPVTPSSIDLSQISAGTGGFKLTGEDPLDFAGKSVSGIGDVNGDGIDDMLVGAHLNEGHGLISVNGSAISDGPDQSTIVIEIQTGPGSAYVVFGSRDDSRNTINLGEVARGTEGIRLSGDGFSKRIGTSVSDAGDVNGDGISDLIIGSNRDGDGGGKRRRRICRVRNLVVDVIESEFAWTCGCKNRRTEFQRRSGYFR